MADVRIFSYLPNPRLFKATIASRLNGVSVNIVGAKPAELKEWLWDFDAHPLTDCERADESTLRKAKKGFSGGIHKTDAFLAAHPFGNVPAAFCGVGKVGIFESNSILRMVARLGEGRCRLYGDDVYEATRIDSFLDASLNFAVESQKYLFSFADLNLLEDSHAAMAGAYESYMSAIDRVLSKSDYIVGDKLSMVDITFACELALFALERHEHERLAKVGLKPVFESVATQCEHAHNHFSKLLARAEFSPDLGVYFEEMTMKQVFG
ncbi:MAG: glutathione S-transferase family protein [Gammaproteobacteria bacterium]